ncbi:DUF6164 domain-containing protein [Vreelandella rituensis]|uniref:DUF2007 domain-containing protein n=1 Tax=Vreelandella rituensis TaxID=2282306 RepID=A0A368UA35_9GAMM|nr:DUF6164 family protein [Halomonas rituensis]RCV93002.1 hypothetical protein DU506_04520 [Halomonas rituensis]
MAKLLFRLHNVTDEEAGEVRDLLMSHGFDTYETHAGFFRMGVEAIWLRDERQLDQAREVLDDYQQARGTRVRAEHQDALAKGEAPTLWRRLAAHPVQVLLVLIAVALIGAISLLPFMTMLGD